MPQPRARGDMFGTHVMPLLVLELPRHDSVSYKPPGTDTTVEYALKNIIEIRRITYAIYSTLVEKIMEIVINRFTVTYLTLFAQQIHMQWSSCFQNVQIAICLSRLSAAVLGNLARFLRVSKVRLRAQGRSHAIGKKLLCFAIAGGDAM